MREAALQHLLVLSDPPYGTERSFNGLRVAHALAKHDPGGGVLLCGTCMDARGLTENRDCLGRCPLNDGRPGPGHHSSRQGAGVLR